MSGHAADIAKPTGLTHCGPSAVSFAVMHNAAFLQWRGRVIL
jgi:hypothetical protein